jgi:hypothetical protein
LTEIYQIFYDEKQRSKLLSYSIPYFNPGLTIFFENDCIVKLVKDCTSEKVGVVSWKLVDKMRKHHIEGLMTKKDSDYQVLSLTRNSSRHSMLAMANAWHPHFKSTIELLWNKLGYKMPGEAKHPIYQNAYIAKTDIYKRYVNEFLSPAIDLIETDKELREKMIQPSGYGKLNRHADMRSVKAKLGMDDYPLCTFILERCPSLFMTMHRIPVTYL